MSEDKKQAKKEAKKEDCKRNSSAHLAHFLHKLEKDFKKAGLSKYSFDLRQKFENGLRDTFHEIEMNDASTSTHESGVAAAVSIPPTPCSPYYVLSSPSYAYSSYSPGNISCSPFYTPSSPYCNPYSPDESFNFYANTAEETNTASLSSKSKRICESDMDRNTDLKKMKMESPESCSYVNEEEDDLGKGNDEYPNSDNQGFEVEEGVVDEEGVENNQL